jgi:nicotinate-nucleotide adenylyltransferase
VRTGILGGTFDPVHYAHLFAAQSVADAKSLDRVLFVTVGSPAHRAAHASAANRDAMVRLAIAGNARFAADDTAMRQHGPVYTADTLALLRTRYPDDAFYFIAGMDSLARSVWRRLDEVAAALEKFIVVSRPGASTGAVHAIIDTLPVQLRARFEFMELPLTDISATDIRHRVASGFPIRYLTPDSVVDYIDAKGLYRA